MRWTIEMRSSKAMEQCCGPIGSSGKLSQRKYIETVVSKIFRLWHSETMKLWGRDSKKVGKWNSKTMEKYEEPLSEFPSVCRHTFGHFLKISLGSRAFVSV